MRLSLLAIVASAHRAASTPTPPLGGSRLPAVARPPPTGIACRVEATAMGRAAAGCGGIDSAPRLEASGGGARAPDTARGAGGGIPEGRPLDTAGGGMPGDGPVCPHAVPARRSPGALPSAALGAPFLDPLPLARRRFAPLAPAPPLAARSPPPAALPTLALDAPRRLRALPRPPPCPSALSASLLEDASPHSSLAWASRACSTRLRATARWYLRGTMRAGVKGRRMSHRTARLRLGGKGRGGRGWGGD